METRAIYSDFKKKILFKSYYVVWKHIQNKQNTKYELWFKSYYVVWKLFEISMYCSAISKGLNRTMQYGNEMKKKIAYIETDV